KWALTLRILTVFVGVAGAAFIMDFWWLSFWLIIAGLGIAPALAVIFSNVAASVKFSETAEAYGWAGTGQLIGAALGSAAAGFMIDGFSATGAFIVAAVFLFFGTLLPALTIRWQPDLSAENLGPHPDTEPIRIDSLG
ncbi:MAG: MFS transporter, partial [Microbacteriaceae bacterium]